MPLENNSKKCCCLVHHNHDVRRQRLFRNCALKQFFKKPNSFDQNSEICTWKEVFKRF